MPEPIVVPRLETTFSALCDRCIAEKNSPFTPERAWAEGEGYEDVTVSGELPLDQDEADATCQYGHDHLVLREGSQRARNFGYASPYLTPKDEKRIAEIRAWFDERGFDLVVHEVGGRWRAPYMSKDTRIGAADYGVGLSAVDAAENAQAKYEAANVYIERGTVTATVTLSGTAEVVPATETDTTLPIKAIGGKPALDKAIEKLTRFDWNILFERNRTGNSRVTSATRKPAKCSIPRSEPTSTTLGSNSAWTRSRQARKSDATNSGSPNACASTASRTTP